ncbi:MAG: TIGR03435 family protein [Verrucomicrobiia bacterium]
MHDATDMDLLRQYADGNSDDAFATLVSRHVDLVYSAALRKTGNPHAAEEITQAVFIILAQKAGRIPAKTILPGWLYQTARLTASSFLRGEIRRVRREQEAYMQTEPHTITPDKTWEELAPLLDDAMGQLGDKDRAAVVLRFFSGKSFADVAAAAGVSENAAKKRVAHALEKLQRYFSKRGVSSTTAVIAGAISTHSIQAAPVAMAKAVTAVAVTKGAAAGGSTLTLINGALKIMACTKMNTAVVVVVVSLLAAGTTAVIFKEIQAHRTYSSYSWQGKEGVIMDEQVNQPPQVRILPSKFHTPDWATLNGKLVGTGVSAQNVVASAYGYVTSARVVFSADLPASLYDYIACLPGGEKANEQALQAEVKRKFGVVGKIETRDMDVWLLNVKYPNAPGLKRNDKDRGNGLFTKPYGFHGWHEAMSNLAYAIEDKAGVPVFDQTGLTDRFDFDLNCTESDLKNHDWDAVNQALGKLGLELVPTNMPLEMLVVEKVK